jgi:hypothetical protein
MMASNKDAIYLSKKCPKSLEGVSIRKQKKTIKVRQWIILEFKVMVEAVERCPEKTAFCIWPEYQPTKINEIIASNPEVTNPAYTRKQVDFFKIDEVGSNMDKNKYNPHSVAQDKDDYFEGIVKRQLDFMPSKNEIPNVGAYQSNLYGAGAFSGTGSVPVFQNAAALQGNNTYDDPKFQNFIAQREREAKMANSLREEF